ncbi:peroxiredoxin [uncultured Algimonas sp.]|uniref:peroxiredoxin n=1 Tax=uncultured Algimonas sp. TaxID=1547920 RepID=UPI0026335F62|nr:peroxiredoxin [uncultured Algimonas sp.]
MTIEPGHTLPDATFMTMGEDGPAPMSASELFSGKRVVLFAVPGAYTPTCSAKHLPGFKDNMADLKAKGVDTVACTSVNDVFVMDAWGKEQGADDVLMLADGNGAFAKELGLEMDASQFGMGTRSQRYAMVVDDGRVEQLFVEGPGEFKVSSAEHVLDNL